MPPKVKTTGVVRPQGPAAQRDSLPSAHAEDGGSATVQEKPGEARTSAYVSGHIEDWSANANRLNENDETPHYPEVAQNANEKLDAIAVLSSKTHGHFRLSSVMVWLRSAGQASAALPEAHPDQSISDDAGVSMSMRARRSDINEK